jgi:hypothetical protein
MTQRIIETDSDRKALMQHIKAHALPMTVSVTKGAKRTTKQNRLQRQWMLDIAAQLDGWTAEEARGYCKLHFGIPILRAEDEAFAAEYDAVIRPLPYELKLKLMMVPFDFGVTRLMSTKQQTAYLDAVHRHFSEQGVALTDPGDLLAPVVFNEPERDAA